MTNSEIRTTKNIKLKEEDKMMKLDLYGNVNKCAVEIYPKFLKLL